MDTVKTILRAIGRAVAYVSNLLITTFLWWIGRIRNASSRKRGCAWFIGGFTILTMLCSLIYAITPGGREAIANNNATSTAVAIIQATSDMSTQNAPTFTPTPTNAATNTPVPPTGTPIPTATEVPPTATNTSVPPTSTNTRTPIPSATPLATIEPNTQAYLDEIDEITNAYTEAFEGLGEQLTDAGTTPALLFEQNWQQLTGIYIAAIRFLNDDVRELVPPEVFSPGHDLLLQAAGHFDEAMDAYVAGIDNLDIDQINQANEALLMGSQIITQANQLFSEIRVSIRTTPLPTASLPTSTTAPQPTPPPQPTNTPAPLPTAPPPTSVPEPTQTAAPSPASVIIIAVNKQDEFVDIQNVGGTDQDLTNWQLVSETGNQPCTLGGVLGAGQVLRIYAQAEDAELGGFNCGFGGPIWNNSESDPAALYDANGNLVDRH